MLALINDILDLATVEAGKHTLAKEDLNFREVVDDCTPIIAGAASQKSIKFTNKVPEELPRLYADRRAIKQILLNLLSNAIKYTPEEGLSISMRQLQTGCSRSKYMIPGLGFRPKNCLLLSILLSDPSLIPKFSKRDLAWGWQ